MFSGSYGFCSRYPTKKTEHRLFRFEFSVFNLNYNRGCNPGTKSSIFTGIISCNLPCAPFHRGGPCNGQAPEADGDCVAYRWYADKRSVRYEPFRNQSLAKFIEMVLPFGYTHLSDASFGLFKRTPFLVPPS